MTAFRPRLFEPSITRSPGSSRGAVMRRSGAETADTNIDSTSSFRYNSPGAGLRSSQQLGVDFSSFENHTFFCSAVANVNVAFDRIIQEYPFDGTAREVEEFTDSLTGFEKYVLDSFPKSRGYLFFSGTQTTETSGGTYIRVSDFEGSLVPGVSRASSGKPVIDPGLKSLSIELHLMPAAVANDNQVIVQKVTGSDGSFGFTLALSKSLSATSCSLVFMVASGSQCLSASASVVKGEFTHACAVLNRRGGVNRTQLFVDAELVSTSQGYAELGDFGFAGAPVTVGSGTSQRASATAPTLFTPLQTFSGALDELRIFHGVRSREMQALHARRTVRASPDLRLHFRFNEPTGSIGSDSIVLDSSGNSLHSLVSNFSHSLRSTGSVATPMTLERDSECPVLFPNFAGVSALNADLLLSASLYDSDNPNLITRLVPGHYLQAGAAASGLDDDDDGELSESYSGGGTPRSGRLGSSQIMTALLYVYAKHFDELKVMIDSFSNVLSVDYDPGMSTPDQFLPLAAAYRGMTLPNMFGDASLSQHILGDNLTGDASVSALSLQAVQNQIWRRILTNLGEIVRSKGTLHSVKAVIRAMGISPDTVMRIREYGGPTRRQLSGARERRTEVAAALEFSGSLASNLGSVDSLGFAPRTPRVVMPFMSGSRRELGAPTPAGNMVMASLQSIHGISDRNSDGLMTSGSWTFEATYRFPSLLTGSHPATQSLARIHATGTASPSTQHALVANMVLFSSESTDEESDILRLYVRPISVVTGGQALTLSLTGVNVFDGNQWCLSFGRQRNTEIGSVVSSSYFLRAARQSYGSIQEFHCVTGALADTVTGSVWQDVGINNTSGTFIVFGSQSVGNTSTGMFLNSVAESPDPDSRATQFSGRLSQVRFWSRSLRVDEWSEHVRNFKSLGVRDPMTGLNFVYKPTGSFGRLRLDASMDQPVTSSDSSGLVSLFDFSQCGMHSSGSGFEPSVSVIRPETFHYSFMSPKFDEAVSSDKVRPRGFVDAQVDLTFSGSVAPVHEILRSDEPLDDPRFSIDISVASALDEDIVSIFATFEAIETAIGRPELMFSPDYPDLEHLRLIYFNRLTDKINMKSFFEFFKWFDSSMGLFIERLLPRKTKFMGVNYVIESHMLERPKFEHLGSEPYLGDSNRHAAIASIYLQQIVGTATRY